MSEGITSDCVWKLLRAGHGPTPGRWQIVAKWPAARWALRPWKACEPQDQLCCSRSVLPRSILEAALSFCSCSQSAGRMSHGCPE